MRYNHLDMLPELAFSPVGKRMTLEGGGKGSPPPAPDYTAAANATAAGNLANARYTTAANRVNQYTPYGSLTYSQGPSNIDQAGYDAALQAFKALPTKAQKITPLPTLQDFTTPVWNARQELSPDQQKLLNQTTALNQGLIGTAQSGLTYANDLLSKPGVDLSSLPGLNSNVDTSGMPQMQSSIDMSQLPDMGINPGETYSDAIMRRLEPQLQRIREQSDTQLANQGVGAGSSAYGTAKGILGQQQNDALTSAIVNGMGMGLQANQQKYNQLQGNAQLNNAVNQALFGQGLSNANLGNTARQQGFQEQAYNQMQPINVINALRTGSQVQNPSFVNPAQMPQTAGPDILGATNANYTNQMNAYNAQQAAGGNFLGGLMQLGGAAMMSPAGTFTGSDETIKENIEKIGSLDNGINVYKFEYKPDYKDTWGHGEHIGVMAQEVEQVIPEAVAMHEDGYKLVNYAMLGA